MKINGGIIIGVVATLLGVSGIINGVDKEIKNAKAENGEQQPKEKPVVFNDDQN